MKGESAFCIKFIYVGGVLGKNMLFCGSMLLIAAMKTCLYIFLGIFLCSLMNCSSPQPKKKGMSGTIIQAIGSGNAENLANYFNSDIELIILEKEGLYSKSQAEQILKEFFKRNGPSHFELNHHGRRNATAYYIGTLYSNTGRYRISYFMDKNFSDEDVIINFRIEDDNN